MKEEHNDIPEQVKIRKMIVEDNIDTEERDNILELLKTPCSGDGSRIEDVMAAVRHNESELKFASEDLSGDRDIVMVAVKQVGWALVFASEDIRRDEEIVMSPEKQYR